MHKIVTCSEIARPFVSYCENAFERGQAKPNATYPFAEMLPGESFAVALVDDYKKEKQRLHAAISNTNKRSGKTFKLFWHDELKCFEIARVK